MTIDDEDWDYDRAETGMESDPMESDDRCAPLREDMADIEDEPADPGRLAEMEDSDGDLWQSGVGSKYIEVRCHDCVDGELNAFMDVTPEDLRDVIRFLVATYKAYQFLPDDMKEDFRSGY